VKKKRFEIKEEFRGNGMRVGSALGFTFNLLCTHTHHGLVKLKNISRDYAH
jgi:hypothetical protein